MMAGGVERNRTPPRCSTPIIGTSVDEIDCVTFDTHDGDIGTTGGNITVDLGCSVRQRASNLNAGNAKQAGISHRIPASNRQATK
jgi:hypothetical protein